MYLKYIQTKIYKLYKLNISNYYNTCQDENMERAHRFVIQFYKIKISTLQLAISLSNYCNYQTSSYYFTWFITNLIYY